MEVEVEVVYADDQPSEACLEPATVHWLDQVARRAETGDVDFLRQAVRVFPALTSYS